jgi:hypothetical protein
MAFRIQFVNTLKRQNTAPKTTFYQDTQNLSETTDDITGLKLAHVGQRAIAMYRTHDQFS